jgi:hypothetical protein
MIKDSILNHINKIGVPPHELKLKVGDVCILTRNLHIHGGIANSTRVQIVRINNYTILVKLLDGTDRIVVVPKVRFEFRVNRGHSFAMIREQFPLRRAYAMTFNKSQGQTMNKVVLDLRSDVFCHGQLYVGVSRVYDWANLYLYAHKTRMYFTNGDNDANFNGGVYVKNIVYRDLLELQM